jgi:hypothetical protein
MRLERFARAPFLWVTASLPLAFGLCTGCGSGDQPAGPPANDAGASGCAQSVGPTPAGAARSAGYSGTEGAFVALFDAPCAMPGDCTAPCVTAGGTMTSCASSSLCASNPVDDGGLRCIPPAYWQNTGGALSGTDAEATAALVVLVDTPYHDALLLTDFGLSVPDDATVVGIQFDVERNSDEGETVDSLVQVLQNGAPVGADHGQTGAWPSALTYTSYGGRSEMWGASWTPAEVRASGFGLSIAPKITATKGNDRAHINSVRATVFYRDRCD